LVQATEGNFDGTTDAGGTNRDGTVFSLGVGLGPFVKTVPTAGKVGGSVRIVCDCPAIVCRTQFDYLRSETALLVALIHPSCESK